MANRGLGTLTLDLVAKIGGFEQGLDKAGRTLDQKSKQMLASAKKLGTEIGLALSAIGGIAAAGFAKYVANTIEAEKVQAQLASRIKDTGNAAGRSIEQLNASADKLQSLTVFDDEAIGGVQAMLLTFREIRDVQFDKATEAVLDLSTAMGMDAQAAALQLGKALNDPIKGVTALGRSGVQFTQTQKDLIKSLVETGDKAAAQNIILAELEGQMGSAAEAARETLGGAIQALQNSFDNLLEGDTSGSGLKGTVDAINDLNDSLNDPSLKSGIDTVAEGILRVATAAIQGISRLGQFAGNLKDIFANAGLAPGQELDQLEARREKLAGAMTGTVIGRLFPESVKKELAEIDKQIAGYAFRNVTSSSSTTGKGYDRGKPSTGGGGAKKTAGKSDEEKEADRLLVAYDRMVASLKEQAEMVGVVSEVERLRYELSNGELSKLDESQKRELLNLTQIAEIRAADFEALQDKIKLEEQETEARDDRMKSNEDLIKDMQFELEMLGMTNDQRERAIALSYLSADATDEQRAAVEGLATELQRASEAQELWDDFKSGLADAFVDFATGAKSAKEALGDFFDNLFAKALEAQANKWIEQLFEGFGSNGSGSGNGDSGSMFDLLSSFGGGRASGGAVASGKFYEVGEADRPELLMAGGKQFLIPGNNGTVVPMRGGGGGVSQVNNFRFDAPTSQRTQEQLAARVGFKSNEALRRNG